MSLGLLEYERLSKTHWIVCKMYLDRMKMLYINEYVCHHAMRCWVISMIESSCHRTDYITKEFHICDKV